MNQAVAQKLRDLLDEHGRSLLRNPDRCSALMSDDLAAFALDASVLRTALRDGVPAELLKSAGPLEAEIPRLASRLQQQHGLSASAAEGAVKTWAYALYLGPISSSNSTSRPKPPVPPPQPSVPHQATDPSPSPSLPPGARLFRWLLSTKRPRVVAASCVLGLSVIGCVLKLITFAANTDAVPADARTVAAILTVLGTMVIAAITAGFFTRWAKAAVIAILAYEVLDVVLTVVTISQQPLGIALAHVALRVVVIAYCSVFLNSLRSVRVGEMAIAGAPEPEQAK